MPARLQKVVVIDIQKWFSLKPLQDQSRAVFPGSAASRSREHKGEFRLSSHLVGNLASPRCLTPSSEQEEKPGAETLI